jgi:hypothetical protein
MALMAKRSITTPFVSTDNFALVPMREPHPSGRRPATHMAPSARVGTRRAGRGTASLKMTDEARARASTLNQLTVLESSVVTRSGFGDGRRGVGGARGLARRGERSSSDATRRGTARRRPRRAGRDDASSDRSTPRAQEPARSFFRRRLLLEYKAARRLWQLFSSLQCSSARDYGSKYTETSAFHYLNLFMTVRSSYP